MIIKDKTFIIKVEFIFFSRYLILDFDCEDKSDEFQCEGIKITNDYAKGTIHKPRGLFRWEGVGQMRIL